MKPDKKNIKYAVEQIVSLYAIPSPSGFTKKFPLPNPQPINQLKFSNSRFATIDGIYIHYR
jgi:hypothetical protein